MSIILRKGLILTSDYNDLENKPAIDGVTLTKDTTKSDLGLADVFVYKGQKPTYADLPTTGNKKGDVWDVADTGNNYAWNGSGWDNLGGISQVKTLKQLGIGYNNVSTKSIAQAIITKALPAGTIVVGGVKLTDFPDSALVNGELTVHVMDTILNGVTVLDITLTSLDVAPYEWITGYRSDNPDANIVWLPMNIQYSTMPTATAYYVDKIIQYTGTTTSDYTNGCFYKGVVNDDVYSWELLSFRAYAPFPPDFVTTGTLEQIVESIRNSSGAKQGAAYLGGISGNCMPWGTGNAECKVEYMTDTIAVMTLNSSNHPPYTWIYNTDVYDYTWKQQVGQYTSNLPTSDAPTGTVVQYAGDTNSTYTKGYFYKATKNGTAVTWSQIDVQPGFTGKYGANLNLNGNALQLKDQDGSLLGNAVTIKAYASFPSDFTTSGTLQEVVQSIKSSSGAVQGAAFLGGISGACTPWGSGNCECKVEFMTNSVAILTCNSSNVAPYSWEYNTASGDFTWKKKIIQVTSMPSNFLNYSVGVIIQYVGTTDANYTNGYFYKCVNNGGTYVWQQVNTQPESAGTITDVKVNGTTVVSGTEANIPYNQTISITYSDGTTATLSLNGSLA